MDLVAIQLHLQNVLPLMLNDDFNFALSLYENITKISPDKKVQVMNDIKNLLSST